MAGAVFRDTRYCRVQLNSLTVAAYSALKLTSLMTTGYNHKKAQLSLTNPRDACEKFAWFT